MGLRQLKQLSVEDRILIHELIGLYGHLIDEREFSRLDEIFTADAEFDLAGYGGVKYQGLPAIIELMMESKEHPLAHHATNIVVEQVVDGRVSVISKGIGVGHKGRVGSVVYKDYLVRLGDQWRISERKVELRSASAGKTAL